VLNALALWGVGFVGTVFWLLSPEAAAAVAASSGGWHPLVVGPLVAVGQSSAHVALYYGGEQLRRRWRWFDQKCERARVRHGRWLARGTVPLGCASGLIGIPPSSVTTALAPGLGLSGRLLLPLLLAMRVLRITTVAYLARAFGANILPHW
jgi:hypothetical protein